MRHRRRSRTNSSPLDTLWLFANCPPAQRKALSTLGVRLFVPSGKTLTSIGSRGSEMFIVITGAAACVVHDREVALFSPGDFFGEVAVLDGGSRTATVTAQTDMEVLVLDPRELETLFELSPLVARRMITVMAGRLRNADKFAVAVA